MERDRRPAYAFAQGLGQAFNFDLLTARFAAGEFRKIVAENLELSAESGSSSTWVLSNHNMVRHPTRYGLPFVEGKTNEKVGHEWLLAGGPAEELTWLATDSADLLVFERPGGWVNLTNFSTEPAPLPADLTEAEFVLGSTPGAADAFAAGSMPGSATLWLKR